MLEFALTSTLTPKRSSRTSKLTKLMTSTKVLRNTSGTPPRPANKRKTSVREELPMQSAKDFALSKTSLEPKRRLKLRNAELSAMKR